jgi:hypothetical protein
MSHHISGLVAAPHVLTSFATEHHLRAPIPLDQGFALLLLLDDDLDAMMPAPQAGRVEGFVYLSAQLGPLVYLETDYFGGIGTQAAVAYGRGDVLVAPRASEAFGPINDALRAIGARAVPPADEFWSVGLQHHREFDGDQR